MPRIGVLGLQGGYDAHLRTVAKISRAPILVKTSEDLSQVDGLIIPGGESTTIGKLLHIQGLFEPIQHAISQGFPVFGTCAGMILLSREVVGRQQPLLGGMDIVVERNAYGRQVESFETTLAWKPDPASRLSAVFIRAPKLASWGPDVEVLAEHEGSPVCIRQNHLLAASFHPELTSSLVLHQYFLDMVLGS
jgi:5'-phosphate synthase pdxT subunit